MGADPDPSAAVLRGEVRRILGEQTPELIKALSGPELQEILLEAHVKAKGGADVQMEGPERPGLSGGIPGGLTSLPGPQGLSNLGNTCYLASVLQCLAQTETFAAELQLVEPPKLGGIGQALQRVLGNLRGDSQASVQEILGELAERYTWYQGKSQQDAHELLRTLLAALADEREVKDEKDVLQRLVQRSFQGLICEAILCWSCRQVTVRHEFFLDLSLDIAEEDLDTGPLGLRGWAMKPLIVPEEEEDEAPAVEEPAPDGLEDQVIQVQLERVPGRRIPLGLEWQDAAKHNCKVLRRVHPNSLADQWNKRSGNGRLVPNLLLLSVNGEEDAEEIMQVLKDEAKLLLRFAPEEVVSARVNEKTQQGFQIELQRDAKTPWGFQLDPAALEEGNLIVAQILPDSVLDAWNLRCRSMGRKQQLVHCGDKILAVNGSRELQQMTKALNSQARQKNVVLLEPGDRGGYSAPSSAPAAEEDATFQVELEPMVSNSSWGFQLERMDGDDVAARVKGLEEGSPVALWNMVCRSRGDEHLCVEADDVLLDAKNAMAAASATPRSFTLRRSRDRQASVRAGGLDRTTARTASAAPRGTAAMEDLRQTMLHAAHGCAAQLAAEASPLATLFGAATPRPRAVSLADCVRNLGSIEALEENFQPIYHCSCCGSDAPRRAFASKRTWLQQLPPVLPVQLKRFRFDAHTGSFQKSRMRIQTTSTLDLSDLILSSEQQQQLQSYATKDSNAMRHGHEGEAGHETLYELYAVCAHLGGSMERGHYVAFINVGASLKDESWFLLDDARCIPVGRGDALKVEAYIAFYRRCTAAT